MGIGRKRQRLVRAYRRKHRKPRPKPEMVGRSVSISEIKRFLNCRLRWRWASAPPRGRGLSPKVSQPALVLGRNVHEALQRGLDYPETSFVDHYNEVVEESSEGEADTTMFKGEQEKILEEIRLGSAMLQVYDDYHERLNEEMGINYFLATETKWDGIEVPGTDATLSGVFDALVETDDGLWILDFKTTSRRNAAWTTQDLQATAYVHAARQMYGPEVRGIIFRFLLKKEPYDGDKLILKSGNLTKRSNLDNLTTYRNYQMAIAVSVAQALVGEVLEIPADPALNLPRDASGKVLYDMLDYNDWKKVVQTLKGNKIFRSLFSKMKKKYFQQLNPLKTAWKNFIWDVEEERTPTTVTNYLQTVLAPAMQEMVMEPTVGPTGLAASWALCGRCPFKEPCKLAMEGAAYEVILDEEFEIQDRYLEEDEDDEEDK